MLFILFALTPPQSSNLADVMKAAPPPHQETRRTETRRKGDLPQRGPPRKEIRRKETRRTETGHKESRCTFCVPPLGPVEVRDKWDATHNSAVALSGDCVGQSLLHTQDTTKKHV